MIFVCGIVDWNAGTTARPLLEPALDALRITGPRYAGLPGAAGIVFAHARCASVEAAAADCAAFLFRPLGEVRAEDETRLAGHLSAYRERGQLPPPDHFGGAFLWCVVDRATRRVHIATDRFAMCPLYFQQQAQRLVFATHLRSLKAMPEVGRSLDCQAIYDYVFFHCIPAPRTIYENVAKLGPAEMLISVDGAVRRASYWQPSFIAADAPVEAAASELPGVIEQAVARRVRPNCGAFLSGGLDSSTVVGMLEKAAAEPSTFTIGFDAAEYDESSYARLAARHFNANYHEYFVTPADVLEALPRIAAHSGEPFGNSSVVPSYHCARFAREHGIELMLAGDGGDELFAGNTRYIEQEKFELYARLPRLLRTTLETGYRHIPLLESLPLTGKGASYIRQAKMGLPDRLQSYNFLHRFNPREVFSHDWLKQVDLEAPWHAWRERYRAPAHADALQRMLYLDWKFTLADNDLNKVNNMCDLAGVEVAYPMLDDAVVDFSTRIGSNAMLAGGNLRGFYKQAMQGFLPAEIIAKSKHGFGLPFGVWMRRNQGLKDLVADTMGSLRRRDIFQAAFIDQAQRLYREETAAGYYGELIWILTMLELWFTEHCG